MMNLDLIFPEIFLSLSIMFLLMVGVFKKNSEKLIYNLSVITLIVLLALVINLFSINETFIFNKGYKIDYLSSFQKQVECFAKRRPEVWRYIGDYLGASQVLANREFDLNLPLVAHSENFKLYNIQ